MSFKIRGFFSQNTVFPWSGRVRVWGDHRSPLPCPGPFHPWDPRTFYGPFLVFIFFPPHSSSSLAVDHVEPKSAPMVGGGPLPRGRGRSVEVIVERPTCLKKGGVVVLKLSFFCQLRFFHGLAGCGFGATFGRPSPWPGPFLPGAPRNLFWARFGFYIFPPPQQ